MRKQPIKAYGYYGHWDIIRDNEHPSAAVHAGKCKRKFDRKLKEKRKLYERSFYCGDFRSKEHPLHRDKCAMCGEPFVKPPRRRKLQPLGAANPYRQYNAEGKYVGYILFRTRTIRRKYMISGSTLYMALEKKRVKWVRSPDRARVFSTMAEAEKFAERWPRRCAKHRKLSESMGRRM